MQRRQFLQSAAAGALAGPPAATAQKKGAPRKSLIKLGTQHDSADAVLPILAAFGVNHICSRLPSTKFDEAWSVEGLTKLRERVESYGIKLDCVPLPLSSSYISKSENPNIMLGKSPERDREIDDICQMIRNASKAGIPTLKYNMSILGVVRTEPTPAGKVSEEDAWERITYFLNRVIPVAAEHKVRMACHPHDPGMPRDVGFRGVHRVLGNVDGLKKFITIKENPYHGLNFCQGTVSEMLKDPGKEIFDVIRYFGSRKKIFNVHFRNIKGGFLKFQETFPDDGDVNFIQAIRVYKEVGFDGMLMPDHVPKIKGDQGGAQAFAYAFGYINALIQMVNQEG